MLYFDNTRVSAYRRCPRYFHLRHMRHYTFDGSRVDLVFGSAWHEGMNALWQLTIDKKPMHEVIRGAMQSFVDKWVEEGFPKPTPENYQQQTQVSEIKNPWIAHEMFNEYYKLRRSFIEDCTQLEVERPFAVPLMVVEGKQVYYIGRLDKVVKHRQHGRLVIEHKTTGWYAKETGFRRDYLESFSPNSQVDGYAFAGNSLYDDGIKGVWVDAALTHKTVHDKFTFIPIDRQFAALDAWLTDTRNWIGRILGEIEANEREVEEGINLSKPMAVFPKNTDSCHQFNGCTFRDVCKYVPNPRAITAPPPGYKLEKWEPFDVLHMDRILNKEGE